MDEPIRRVDQTTTQTGDTTQTTEEIREPNAEVAHKQNVLARIIWYVAGIILVLLAFRFVLALLGANSANGFANFIYATSHPFAEPFFGLFGYTAKYGISRVELSTLVAMAVYALVAFGLAKLVTITQEQR
jgi:uncharacterized protein YggT (Ycf19 family)